MNALQALVGNRILWTCLAAWFLAQVLKIPRVWLKEKRFSWKILFELGGMPSSHSATVSALATSIGIIRGFDSPEFAISSILAMIVMTDASGVRRAVGNHAIKINEMLDELIHNGDLNKTVERLKEILGHTPFQVLIGMLLGIAVALIAIR